MKRKKSKRKLWITVWFIAAAISLSVITAYAIYTRVTIAKRVVSTQAGASSLFSSDYMNVGGMKTIEPVSDNTKNATVSVHVFNFEYPKEAVFRSEDTEYDLTVTLGTIDGSGEFTALSDTSGLSDFTYSAAYKNTDPFVFNSTNGITKTFGGCSIPGNGANSDDLTLVFDKNEIGNNPNGYCFKIEADPSDTDLPKLTGYVMVRFSKQASTGWRGELESLDNSKSYDGYNYYLEGTGKGKLTFKWNPTYVTINKDFLNNPENEFYYIVNEEYVKYAIPPVESLLTQDADGYVSLTIKVDSTIKNRYEVQFFKVDSTNDQFDYSNGAVKNYLPDTSVGNWSADSTS